MQKQEEKAFQDFIKFDVIRWRVLPSQYNSPTSFWSLSSLLNKAVLTLGRLNALVSSLKRYYEWGLGVLHRTQLPRCLTYHYIALACRTFPLSLRRGNLLDFLSFIPEVFTIVQEGRVLECNCTNCSPFTWFLRILKCKLQYYTLASAYLREILCVCSRGSYSYCHILATK